MNELLPGIIIILVGLVVLFAVYLLVDMAAEVVRGIVKAIKEKRKCDKWQKR